MAASGDILILEDDLRVGIRLVSRSVEIAISIAEHSQRAGRVRLFL